MFIQVLCSHVYYHMLVMTTLGPREQHSRRNKFKFQVIVRVTITAVPVLNAGK